MWHMDATSSTFAARVAAELRGERATLDIDWDALAEATGLSESSVRRYLKGTRDIPMSAFVELCRALALKPTAVFERAEERAQED